MRCVRFYKNSIHSETNIYMYAHCLYILSPISTHAVTTKKSKRVLYREKTTSRRLWPAHLAELRLPAHDLGSNSSRGAGASSQRLLLCQADLCWLAGCLCLRIPNKNHTRTEKHSIHLLLLFRQIRLSRYTLNSITLLRCQSGGPSLRR